MLGPPERPQIFRRWGVLALGIRGATSGPPHTPSPRPQDSRRMGERTAARFAAAFRLVQTALGVAWERSTRSPFYRRRPACRRASRIPSLVDLVHVRVDVPQFRPASLKPRRCPRPASPWRVFTWLLAAIGWVSTSTPSAVAAALATPFVPVATRSRGRPTRRRERVPAFACPPRCWRRRGQYLGPRAAAVDASGRAKGTSSLAPVSWSWTRCSPTGGVARRGRGSDGRGRLAAPVGNGRRHRRRRGGSRGAASPGGSGPRRLEVVAVACVVAILRYQRCGVVSAVIRRRRRRYRPPRRAEPTTVEPSACADGARVTGEEYAGGGASRPCVASRPVARRAVLGVPQIP